MARCAVGKFNSIHLLAVNYSLPSFNSDVAYLLALDIGQEAAADFVASLATTELTLETPLQEDYLRSADILRQYTDANVDFVDALIVATAERLNIKRLLTLDRRDFQLILVSFCRETNENRRIVLG
jgi:predicted nucleic acid-binding protein